MAGIGKYTEIPKSAEVCLLHDVGLARDEGRRVRLIGRLYDQDLHQQTVVLTSPDKEQESALTVSVKLIYPFEANLGSLYEVLGEFASSDDGLLFLQAHTWRCMDGLDWKMYRRVIEMRKEYFKRRDDNTTLYDQDLHQQTVVLTSPDKEQESALTVSVKLIYPFEANLGSLYEVLGEFASSDDGLLFLQAHTWRCMDGLDWKMYRRVIEMRKEYFKRRDDNTT